MPDHFYIDNIPVRGDLILAPMDGYSDYPFRSMVRSLGSALSYTEFINAQEVLSKRINLLTQIRYAPEERPVVYQLFDDDPERLLRAALKLQEWKPDILDINMGCSVRAVSGRGAGAGLLKDPVKIATIIRQISNALDIPVTAKIRLGWDEHSRNYLEVARIIEENGGRLLAVHGRTRNQTYQQKADWDAIAEIKQSVSIPVIGNGDVNSPEDIQKMKEHTLCDGVMIGRAAIKNPWIFSRKERNEVTKAEEYPFIFGHLERMIQFYGEKMGVRRFRKFAKGYLSPYRIPLVMMHRLLTCEEPNVLRELILECLELHPDAGS